MRTFKIVPTCIVEAINQARLDYMDKHSADPTHLLITEDLLENLSAKYARMDCFPSTHNLVFCEWRGMEIVKIQGTEQFSVGKIL